MYECVMELRKHEGQGCILADDMGLGKTLQVMGLALFHAGANGHLDDCASLDCPQ